MIWNRVLVQFAKLCIALRYRVRVRGMGEVLARGRRGILFLPNHPALIDPIIVLAHLYPHFRPVPLADQDQVDRFFIRYLARRIGAVTKPDLAHYGPGARGAIRAALARCVRGLREGQNFVLYPAGHIYRQRREDLRGNSGVHRVLAEVPDARIVLVRTRGLWGSAFSQIRGDKPRLGSVLARGLAAIAANGVVATPKRDVSIELFEPDDFPRRGNRDEINRYLERYYNDQAPPGRYVPYTIWEPGRPRTVPDPPIRSVDGSTEAVPPVIRRAVYEHLKELAGVDSVDEDDQLAADLGLDSLARADLLVFVEREFGHRFTDVDSLRTVGDLLLVACGQSVSTGPMLIKPPAGKWFRRVRGRRLSLPAGSTLAEVFLAQARRDPGLCIGADQRSGCKRYRELITALLLLQPRFEKLPGSYLGVMLPASVAGVTAYLAAMFAGKTPVMVNWTVGARNVTHCLDLTGTQAVVTSRALIQRLGEMGQTFPEVEDRFVYLEDMARRITTFAKLSAALRSRVSWRPLREAPVAETAAVLFTSGSESLPKAVPLSHANILANLRDVLATLTLTDGDRMLAMLPPFHAFGLTVDVLAAVCAGLPTVYHPDPTAGAELGRLVAEFHLTMLVGTPTMLRGILRSSEARWLRSLRLAVTGAERCPPALSADLAAACPGATILEGYGVTEGSPIVSVNDEQHPVPGAIGRVLPSVHYAIVDADAIDPDAPGEARRVEDGEQGMLLLRGPSIFEGYLGAGAPNPFVEFEGLRWYKTGDVVRQDGQGVLTFVARRKRFVKVGGEMISLPAIEAVLEPHLSDPSAEGPTFAVTSADDDANPELVLFATRPADRATVNGWLREGGMSPLHMIRRVVEIDEIPLLGTGKTDYRSLQGRLG